MKRRIYKEYRVLAPFWAAALALPLAPLLWAPLVSEVAVFCCMGYALGCALLGTAGFGVEWNHQTMEMLLVQPSTRRQLWREKMRVLAPALATVCVAFVACLLYVPGGTPRLFTLPYGWIWIIFPVLWALGTGPYCTLCNANVVVALVNTLGLPVSWIAVMLLLLPNGWDAELETAAGYAFCAFAVPLVLLAGAIYQRAKYRFDHLDTSRVNSPAIHWPDWLSLSRPAKTSAQRTPIGQSLLSLVGKECRLQAVSYLVAGSTVLLTTVLVAGRQVCWYVSPIAVEGIPYFDVFRIGIGVMIAGAVLMPLIVGSVAVAEERQMGLWEWHLTFPPTHLRQWLIKLSVTLGHLLLLGILLPVLVVVALCWLSQTSANPVEFNLDLLDLAGISALSLLATLISFFTSSAAKTSLRAILLSLTVMIMATVIGNLMIRYLVSSNDYVVVKITYILMGLGMGKYWVLGAVIATALFTILYLSYANYRRLKARFGLLPQMLVVSVATVVLFTSPFYFNYFTQQEKSLRDLAEETGLSVPNALALKRLDARLIPVLAAMLENPVQARQATGNLCAYLGNNREVLPLLVRALTNAQPGVRIRATHALIGAKDLFLGERELLPKAEDALFHNLKADEVKDGATALRALVSLAVDPAKLIPLLLQILAAPTTPPDLRLEVIGALGKLGPAARMAVPALSAIAQDNAYSSVNNSLAEREVQAALAALIRIDAEPHKWIAVLLNKLEDPKTDEETVIRIIDRLGQLDGDAKAAIPALQTLARGAGTSLERSRNERIRRHANDALYLIDPKSSDQREIMQREIMQRRYGIGLGPGQ